MREILRCPLTTPLDRDLEIDGDVLFPELDPAEWILQSEELRVPDERNKHAFTIRVYNRLTG